MVATWGGIGAVSDTPIGVARMVPETRRMLESCMHEILAVAQARGIHLGSDTIGDTTRTLRVVDRGRYAGRGTQCHIRVGRGRGVTQREAEAFRPFGKHVVGDGQGDRQVRHG